MRIFSYNILDGGIGRADPLAEVIEAQRADVVVLVEADDGDVVARIANRLKMDYVIAPGHGHSAAVLSRLTIGRTINHALLVDGGPRSFLEVTIEPEIGRAIALFALHFSAQAQEADEQKRDSELATLLKTTAPLRAAGQPHVLAGDFNANSPRQRIDIAKAKLSLQKAYAKNGQCIPRRVIQQVLDAGYIDALAWHRGEAADRIATFTTHCPQQRVDYIFAHGFPRDAITSAWVEQDRLAQFASDHFPVGAELALS